jgi:hypothetical protein
MAGSPARRDDAAAYHLDYEENDLVIRIPSALLDRDRVSQFLDYLILEQGSRELGLTEDEVAGFARAAKRSAWERLRPMVEEKRRGS